MKRGQLNAAFHKSTLNAEVSVESVTTARISLRHLLDTATIILLPKYFNIKMAANRRQYSINDVCRRYVNKKYYLTSIAIKIIFMIYFYHQRRESGANKGGDATLRLVNVLA